MWSLHAFKILIVREFGHAKEQSKRQIMIRGVVRIFNLGGRITYLYISHNSYIYVYACVR